MTTSSSTHEQRSSSVQEKRSYSSVQESSSSSTRREKQLRSSYDQNTQQELQKFADSLSVKEDLFSSEAQQQQQARLTTDGGRQTTQATQVNTLNYPPSLTLTTHTNKIRKRIINRHSEIKMPLLPGEHDRLIKEYFFSSTAGSVTSRGAGYDRAHPGGWRRRSDR